MGAERKMDMNQSWKKKIRKGMTVLLAALLLCGAWSVPTSAQITGGGQ